jgi:hypothetical protein
VAKSLSSLRAQLLQLTQDIQQLQEIFLEREPLLPGSVYTLKRRCGKPNCRCAKGHLHQTEVLSYRGGSRPRNITPRPAQLERFKQGAEAYRRFRQARAHLVKLQRQMVKLVDLIEAERVGQGERKFNVSPKQTSSSSRKR